MLDPAPKQADDTFALTEAILTEAVPCRPPDSVPVKPPTAKKIFVFLDGTGNEFVNEVLKDSGNSNVVKLYTALRVADDQVAYYHPGVGTMGDPTIHNPILRYWSMIKGLAFGAGFKANVLDAYQYLMNTYNDGDDIYIFGFSRGAYTARALASMLHGYGLLCRGNEGHLLYAWNMFQENMAITRKRQTQSKAKESGSITPNKAFKLTYSHDVTIRFMGIWDTVSSVGWINKPLRLLSVAQNPILQVGRHAISIDERRAFYRDNLWGEPVPFDSQDWHQSFKKQKIQQDLAQVWFPGAHSDVGGSYGQADAAPANVTLEWMIKELQRHGALLCQDRIDLVLGRLDPDHPDFNPAAAPHLDPDIVKIYKFPKKDNCLHDSLTWKWWLLQLLPQQYYSKDNDVIQLRVPFGRPRAIPAHAIIHGSAKDRLDATTQGQQKYCPGNLDATLVPFGEAAPELLPKTNADLSKCYVCVLPSDVRTTVPDDSPPVRYAKLVLGPTIFTAVLAIVPATLFCAIKYGPRLAQAVRSHLSNP
jgi:uncharacterized protein (DUF2235 family)